MSRYAHRVDRMQAEVVAALHGLGVWVWDASALGGGFPDLLCAYQGRLRLVEVKTGNRSLTRPEGSFVATCPVQVHIVRNTDEVVAMVNQWRRDADL